MNLYNLPSSNWVSCPAVMSGEGQNAAVLHHLHSNLQFRFLRLVGEMHQEDVCGRGSLSSLHAEMGLNQLRASG